MDEILGKLYKQPLLDVLGEQELEKIAPLFEVRRYESEQPVFRRGEPSQNFFLISKGEFEVLVLKEGEERRINLLYMGEFFGDISLLRNESRSATVRSVDDSEVLLLSNENFLRLLQLYPPLAMRLEIQGRDIEQRTKLAFPGQGRDEVVLHFSRRHWMALVRRLMRTVFVPLLLWFIGMGVAAYIFQNDLQMQSTVAIIGVIILILPVVLGLWQTLDWYNDYFIVTNERVILVDKVVLFSETRYEAPLNKIQNVNVAHYTPLSEILGYGNMIIATAASAGPSPPLILDYFPKVDIVAQHIIQELNKERGILRQQGQDQKRHNLRAALGLVATTESAKAGGKPPEEPTIKKEGSAIGATLDGVIRYLKPMMREQKGSTIIWRKHWIRLLLESAWAWLVFFGVLLFVIAELFFLDITQFGQQLILGVGIAGLVASILGLWYTYEDWRNDQYILTPEAIVDQEQKPFGFDKQVRRASLDMIQDSRYVQPNPLMVMFNVGNVVIQTAGQEGNFTFKWVKDPRAVQYDIFQYIQQRQAQRERNEAAAISQELLDFIKMYDEEKEEARKKEAAKNAPLAPDDESDPDAPTREWPFG